MFSICSGSRAAPENIGPGANPFSVIAKSAKQSPTHNKSDPLIPFWTFLS
jgi:hypothetical protein